MVFIETSTFTRLIYDYLTRVIYYWKRQDDEIWMLTIYAKNEVSTIPGHILRKIAEEIKK